MAAHGPTRQADTEQDKRMTPTPARSGKGDQVATITSAATLDAFREMVFMVPEAPEDDGSSIIAAILQADDWEDANQEDGLPSSKTLIGRRVIVDKIARKVSDQESATGYYLMCDGVDAETRKPLRFTAGGAQVVAILAKAHVSGWLPARVEFTESTTKSGNTAVNCKLLAIREKSGV